VNNKLRDARTQANFTQEDVARAAKIPVRMYQSYEYGDRVPRATTAIRIAMALHCKVEDIFEEEERAS
jgi:DNA-binding XRE family transcriptional regulator